MNIIQISKNPLKVDELKFLMVHEKDFFNFLECIHGLTLLNKYKDPKKYKDRNKYATVKSFVDKDLICENIKSIEIDIIQYSKNITDRTDCFKLLQEHTKVKVRA